jgi:hypothetical protein
VLERRRRPAAAGNSLSSMTTATPGVTSWKPVLTNLPTSLHFVLSHSRLDPER